MYPVTGMDTLEYDQINSFQVPPSLRILSSYSVFFMHDDVHDLAGDIPTSLYESLLEMKDSYEEYERNIEVQKQVLHEDHEEW